MAAIDVKNLTFGYGKSPVLTDVNLSIDENDFVAIIGPNGGGKADFLNALDGSLNITPGS